VFRNGAEVTDPGAPGAAVSLRGTHDLLAVRRGAPQPREETKEPTSVGGELGFTYIEMVATAAILMILASAIMPMARVSRQRQKEIELRRELRTLRTAIDRYKQAVDAGQIGGADVKVGGEGYPQDLETLVKGVAQVGQVDRKLKFLRRIPVDPMTNSNEWGMRCYQDDPDTESWCGQNVWDVYSKSQGKALDGTLYKDW
jgi:general secretion pathway protein G